jgi:hypothetical protein
MSRPARALCPGDARAARRRKAYQQPFLESLGHAVGEEQWDLEVMRCSPRGNGCWRCG